MDIHFVSLKGLLAKLEKFNICMECGQIDTWKKTPRDYDGECICPWCDGSDIKPLITVIGIEDSQEPPKKRLRKWLYNLAGS